MSERGCGNRVAGGVYLECKVGGSGPMIETFLSDPVRLIDVKELGIPSLGQVVEELDHRVVVFDRVGVKHYPDAADLVEEVLTLGASRRISKTSFPFEKLKQSSALVLIHDRAALSEEGIYESLLPYRCPTGRHLTASTPFCIGSIYSMLTDAKGDQPVDLEEARERLFDSYAEGKRSPGVLLTEPIRRSRPSLSYVGFGHLTQGLMKYLTPAIVATLPITNVAVVNDPEDQEGVERAVDTAQRGGLPVEVVNE